MKDSAWLEYIISNVDRIFGTIEIPWESEITSADIQVGELNERNSRKPRPPAEWQLDTELLRWTPDDQDAWTLEDAFRGTQILGSTGGGKTSGGGQAVGKAFLEHGMGGLVLCVKEDEAQYWEDLCKKSGRLADLRRITLDGEFCYNFLEAEAGFGSQMLTQNISELFLEIIALVNRSPRDSQKDSFWNNALNKVLNEAIVLAKAAEGEVTIATLTKIITYAVPSESTSDVLASLSIARRLDPSQEYLSEIYRQARASTTNELEVEQAIAFFSDEFTKLADKTRSIVVTSFTSMADSLLRRPLRTLLCQKTTLRPEDTFDGKIIVVDVPIHVNQRVGQVINLVWKTAFKRACQRRRKISKSERPVFLWADESHYLFDQLDSEFQTTARSSRCCTVLLTQNLQNYFAKMGDRAAVEALLGSLHNKIYHQNNESTTNQFAAESIGRVPIETKSTSSGHAGSKSVTTSTQWDFDVPPRAFTNLRSGGPKNGLVVDGIVHLPGRKFSQGKTWIKAVFSQSMGS